MRSRRGLALLSAVVVALVASACSSDGSNYAAKKAPIVSLGAGASKAVTIGVLRSSDPALTAQAFGARVAEFRLNGLKSSGKVKLIVTPDGGTAESAKTALDSLVAQGAQGVVVTGSGSYLSAALQRASEVNVPVLLPFATNDDLAPSAAATNSVWFTGPTSSATVEVLEDVAASHKLELTVIDTGDGFDPNAISASALPRLSLQSTADPIALDAQVKALGTIPTNAAVIVWGPPASAANVTAALGRLGGQVPVPIFLPSSATGKEFSDAMAKLQTSGTGIVDAPLTSVATTSDLDNGDDMQGFVTALRLAAKAASSDDATHQILGLDDVAIGSGILSTDVRAHDAVLLLVAAARAAKTVKPSDVAVALRSLRADAVPGLVGPMPDFSFTRALAPAELKAVQADPLGNDSRRNLIVTGTASEGFQLSWSAIAQSS